MQETFLSEQNQAVNLWPVSLMARGSPPNQGTRNLFLIQEILSFTLNYFSNSRISAMMARKQELISSTILINSINNV